MAPLPGGKVAAGRRQEGLIALLLLRSGRGRKGRGREDERGTCLHGAKVYPHSLSERGGKERPLSLFLKEDAAEREKQRRNGVIHLQGDTSGDQDGKNLSLTEFWQLVGHYFSHLLPRSDGGTSKLNSTGGFYRFDVSPCTALSGYRLYELWLYEL